MDNGRTWEQKTVEAGLEKGELPTEQSAVYLGNGRILALARTEDGGASTASQFQLASTDDGATWTRVRTNIRDVQASTPSLIYDAEKGLVYNYYYERGRKVINRRAARPRLLQRHACRHDGVRGGRAPVTSVTSTARERCSG